jgi:hypothetical protein
VGKGYEAALKAKRSPLEVILARMNGEAVTDDAFQAAIAAAPYIHPRLTSADTTIKSDNTHHIVSDEPMTAEQWSEQYAIPANDAVSSEAAADEEASGTDGP